MLGADAALHAGDHIMHHAIDIGGLARSGVGVVASGDEGVVMQITVAQMAKANHARARKV